MADPLQFSDLYGDNGVGFLVSDTDSNSATDRKRVTNDAYVELAGIKGFWRRRKSEYTSASSPALADGTREYAAPSDFDEPLRLYYYRNGKPHDVPIIDDAEWIERSRTATSDKGDPDYARIKTTASGTVIELNRAIDSNFISSIGTLTLEYYIRITRLSADADEPILPANLRHYIVPVAALKYAKAQGDPTLIAALREDAAEAKLVVKEYDLTRLGRSGRLKPNASYEAHSVPVETYHDYS